MGAIGWSNDYGYNRKVTLGGSMNLRSASIIYYQGKFYIPSSVESESGIIIDAEPVYVTGVDF